MSSRHCFWSISIVFMHSDAQKMVLKFSKNRKIKRLTVCHLKSSYSASNSTISQKKTYRVIKNQKRTVLKNCAIHFLQIFRRCGELIEKKSSMIFMDFWFRISEKIESKNDGNSIVSLLFASVKSSKCDSIVFRGVFLKIWQGKCFLNFSKWSSMVDKRSRKAWRKSHVQFLIFGPVW